MYDELLKRIHRQAAYLPEKFSKNAELLDVLMKAADAIEQLQGKHFMMKKTAEWLAEKVPKWIPVTERLPEAKIGYYVLVYEDGDIMMASYSGGEWYLRDMYEIIELKPTHWMPLPEPPKEE